MLIFQERKKYFYTNHNQKSYNKELKIRLKFYFEPLNSHFTSSEHLELQ